LNGISFVGSDDIGGAEKLTEYLIGLGHRKICVLTYKHALNLKPVQDRIAGYKNVMSRNDLAPMPEIVISPSKRGYEAHQREICNFFSGVSKQDMPTAVFSSSDHVAGDVIIAASDMGIKVPEELSVVGFSDSAVSRFLRPQLTTMHESPFEVGKVSAEIISTLIEAKLAGKPLDQMLPIKRYLSTYLVERESATYVNKNL
jgi:DNA-binding LacI/PurR family transcriptional regulator